MKRFAILALLIPCAAFAQTSIHEGRTPHHAVTVNVAPAGDDVIYDVAIRDLPEGRLLTSARLQGKAGAAVEKQMDVGGQHVSINVSSKSDQLAYRIDIKSGDTLLDSIQSAPERQPLRLLSGAGDPPLRVGGDVKAPVVINRVEPIYTELARQSRISGIVILEVVIDHTGVVKDVQVLKPLPFGLDQAAIDAVKQWTFRPGTLNGQAVDVIFNLTINFRAAEPASTVADPIHSAEVAQPMTSPFPKEGQPLRVGGDVKAPVVIKHVNPIITDLAKRSGIGGVVIVEALIDHTGVVKDARILKALPFGLDQSALNAVKQWTFRPATLNGQAVDVFFNVTINFAAADSIRGGGATTPALSSGAAGGPPFRVGGDVTPPVVLNHVEPIYPAVARKARIAGTVIIEAVIDQTGVVKDVHVLKPLPFGLTEAALEAVRQWQFQPGMLDGKPVDVIFNLTVNFRLPEPPPEPPPQ